MMNNVKKNNFKVFTFFIILLSMIFFFVSSSFANKVLLDNNDDKSNYIKMKDDLVIPTRDSVISDGYPTNENGQTYGPNMENLTLVEPDLVLAEGADGVSGYIYQPKGMLSPSELDEYNESVEKSTPLYLQDGKTIIGTFYYN